MLLPGKVRVTETVGTPPSPSTVLIEFVADDGTVYDSSGQLPTKSGQPVTYGHLYAEVQIGAQFEGLGVTPKSDASKGGTGPGGKTVLSPAAPGGPGARK